MMTMPIVWLHWLSSMPHAARNIFSKNQTLTLLLSIFPTFTFQNPYNLPHRLFGVNSTQAATVSPPNCLSQPWIPNHVYTFFFNFSFFAQEFWICTIVIDFSFQWMLIGKHCLFDWWLCYTPNHICNQFSIFG